jgi:hypothetical protein
MGSNRVECIVWTVVIEAMCEGVDQGPELVDATGLIVAKASVKLVAHDPWARSTAP